MVDKKILREMSQDVLVIPFTEKWQRNLTNFAEFR